MNILITGGVGFIGSQLCLEIEKRHPDYNITIIDVFNNEERLTNGNYKFLGSYENILSFNGNVICDDMRKININEVLSNGDFDIIYYLSAISDTRAKNQNELIANNTSCFFNILEYCAISNCKLVYASSASVYGTNKKSKNEFVVGQENPDNVYAYSKYLLDKIANNYSNKDANLKVVGLRYFNVYGPGEKHKFNTSSTILQFANCMLSERPIKLFENSDSICRDFIYIDDVIEATIQAGFGTDEGIFNIGYGEPRSFLEVAQLVKDYLGSSQSIEFIPNPYSSGYQNFTCANLEGKRLNNFIPSFNLESGIQKYLKILGYVE